MGWQFLKIHMLIIKVAFKMFIDNLSCFCHSFCLKENFWMSRTSQNQRFWAVGVLEKETSVSAIARQFGMSTQTITSLPDDLPRHHLCLRHHNAQWDRVVFSDKCWIKLSKTGEFVNSRDGIMPTAFKSMFVMAVEGLWSEKASAPVTRPSSLY